MMAMYQPTPATPNLEETSAWAMVGANAPPKMAARL